MTVINTLIIVGVIQFIIGLINTLLFDTYDKLTNKTKYKGNMPLYFVYFGIFMFPFYKTIRKRKTLSAIKRTVK